MTIKTKRISKNISLSQVLIYVGIFVIFLCCNKVGACFEPFSLSALVALRFCGTSPFICLLLFFLSGAVSLEFEVIIIYGLQTVVCLFFFLVKYKTKKGLLINTILCVATCLIPFMIMSTDNTNYLHLFSNEYLLKVFFSIAIALLTFIFGIAFKSITQNLARCRLKTDECVCSLFSLFVVGVGYYNLVGGFIFFATSILICMVISAIIKSPSSIYAGLIFSLIHIIASGSFVGIFAYLICSAVAFIFQQSGKVVTAVSVFFCLNLYFFIEFFATAEYVLSIAEVLSYNFIIKTVCLVIPLLIFIFVPKCMYVKCEGLLSFYKIKQIERLTINRNRQQIGEKLFEISAVFKEIESTFDSLSQDTSSETSVKNYMLSQIMCKACVSCKGCLNIENGQENKQSNVLISGLKKLIEVGIVKGRVSLVDLSKDITSNCINPSALLDEVNNQLKKYKQCMLEKENANAGRQVMSQNAKGIAEIIKNLALEQSTPFVENTNLEKKISAKLSKLGIHCSEILLYGESCLEGEDFLNCDKITISIIVYGQHSLNQIVLVCSDCCSINLVVVEKLNFSTSKVCYVLKNAPRYDACFGVATQPKAGEELCGDTYSITKIDEQKFMVALSDGMGSGDFARKISANTLALLESFYKAQMPSSVILNTVNKLMSFSSEEGFACIDVAVFDLSCGKADIVKIGSPMAIVFSEGKIKVIETTSLPLGILESLKPTTVEQTLKSGDVLIFVTDGITNAFDSTVEFYEFLKFCPTQNPQAIADCILNKAQELSLGQASDDMSVLAVRIFEEKTSSFS